MYRFALLSIFCACLGFSEQVQIDLQDPSYEDGVASTTNGGLLQSSTLHLQAKTIRYENYTQDGVLHRTILAEGDLMVEYDSRIFIGDKFYYDFVEKKGELINAKTSDDLWIICGEKIIFLPDKSVKVFNASVTTSENTNTVWAFRGKDLTLSPGSELKAKHVTFEVQQLPIFYLPKYFTYLKRKDDSPFRYSLTWDTGQGPKLGMRYQVFSTKTLAIYWRVDFRWNRGAATALETDYKSLNQSIKFQTKSYVAHDTFVNDPDPNRFKTRYRLQGIFKSKSPDKKMDMLAQYDYISDKFMPGDFPSDDFELSTAKRTEAIFNRRDKLARTNIYLRPKINEFQGFMQELPSFHFAFKPFTWEPTGVVYRGGFYAQYLDYEYSKDMQLPVGQAPLQQFHSVRAQTDQMLSRPINFQMFNLTPELGFKGIYYNNNPTSDDVAIGIVKAKLSLDTYLKKYTNYGSHIIHPYASFTHLHLTDPNKRRFIFSIQDGWNDLELLKVGLSNAFYSGLQKPSIFLDVYGYGFFDDNTFKEVFPRIYSDLTINSSRMTLGGSVIYNIFVKSLEKSNVFWAWTLANRLALSANWQYRSKFSWRKNQPENFILDVSKTTEELLNSPLSDKRNTLLVKAQLNVTPFTYIQLASHTGWGRKAPQKFYTESNVSLFTMITANWQLRLTYQHTVNADQVSFGLKLIPHKSKK